MIYYFLFTSFVIVPPDEIGIGHVVQLVYEALEHFEESDRVLFLVVLQDVDGIVVSENLSLLGILGTGNILLSQRVFFGILGILGSNLVLAGTFLSSFVNYQK